MQLRTTNTNDLQIDYISASSSCAVDDFVVLDPDINFSDHVPLAITVRLSAALNNLVPQLTVYVLLTTRDS